MLLSKTYYHIGIVVKDMEKAFSDYRSQYGVQFAEPTITELHLENPVTNTVETVSVKVSYSRTKSPYIELIEAVGDSVFSTNHIGGILYYGYWDGNIAGRIRQLQQNGIAIDAIISGVDKIPNAIITAPNSHGVRIEYVTDKIVGYVRAWTLTGKAPGTWWLSTSLAIFFSGIYGIKKLFYFGE